MRWLPSSLVIHRLCPLADPLSLVPIGTSRDGKLIHLARTETVDAFRRMSEAAGKENVRLHVIWAYRPPALQLEQFRESQLKHGKRGGIRWLAPPGFSEHQTGWVLDLGDQADPEADDNPLFERTRAFRWLKEHARAFGFELSFRLSNWQGVGYEPWHWRFVGTPDARGAFHPKGRQALWVWGRSWGEALRWWLQP
ncbi:MAG: M15 family metallopeptidase [Elusimicrobiota bacterium]|jgi:LAS superfamily LD-carboxypeptidase LdcB